MQNVSFRHVSLRLWVVHPCLMSNGSDRGSNSCGPTFIPITVNPLLSPASLSYCRYACQALAPVTVSASSISKEIISDFCQNCSAISERSRKRSATCNIQYDAVAESYNHMCWCSFGEKSSLVGITHLDNSGAGNIQ